jgi:hypothetical protein
MGESKNGDGVVVFMTKNCGGAYSAAGLRRALTGEAGVGLGLRWLRKDHKCLTGINIWNQSVPVMDFLE